MYNFVVLPIKSDMSDKRKTSTCYLDVLIFRVLWHACNECNVFSKVEKIWYNLTLKESQRIHENYPKIKKPKYLTSCFGDCIFAIGKHKDISLFCDLSIIIFINKH